MMFSSVFEGIKEKEKERKKKRKRKDGTSAHIMQWQDDYYHILEEK
jgi:hypothetical protein